MFANSCAFLARKHIETIVLFPLDLYHRRIDCIPSYRIDSLGTIIFVLRAQSSGNRRLLAAYCESDIFPRRAMTACRILGVLRAVTQSLTKREVLCREPASFKQRVSANPRRSRGLAIDSRYRIQMLNSSYASSPSRPSEHLPQSSPGTPRRSASSDTHLIPGAAALRRPLGPSATREMVPSSRSAVTRLSRGEHRKRARP